MTGVSTIYNRTILMIPLYIKIIGKHQRIHIINIMSVLQFQYIKFNYYKKQDKLLAFKQDFSIFILQQKQHISAFDQKTHQLACVCKFIFLFQFNFRGPLLDFATLGWLKRPFNCFMGNNLIRETGWTDENKILIVEIIIFEIYQYIVHIWSVILLRFN